MHLIYVHVFSCYIIKIATFKDEINEQIMLTLREMCNRHHTIKFDFVVYE